LIQKTRHLDSIVARALLVADFMDSIGQSATSAGHASMSERSPEADIELSCVNVAEEHRRGVSKSTFPTMECWSPCSLN
jgi:hypothetical protein